MSRRGVIAANRAIGTAGRGGVASAPNTQLSPMAQDLAHAMGIPTQPAASSSAPASSSNGWGDAYGGFGLPRQPDVFTDGAFTPYMPVPSVPVDVAEPGRQPYPRREEYRVGWNLPVGQPGTEGLKLADFNTLRTIADLYSVARACIEFLKAQITSLEWEIMPTKDAAKAMRNDKGAMKDFGKRRAAAVKFFKRPDPDYFSWQTWLSDVLEETLVYDALSIVIREKRGKGLGKGLLGSDLDCLNLINGPTIRPLYDVSGGRPRPPAVGYQQYLYGVPRVDLWTMITERDLDESGLRGSEWKAFGGNQLMYVPATPRRWTPYGFSPVERALIPIMTGLQKQAYQLDYFREGTIPGVFISPGGANADMSSTQIRELQTALNAIAGDPAWKHKILVLPADSHVTPMRSQALADALDEIVMAQTCMGFGVQPMQIGIMPKVSATTSPGAANQMAKMSGDQQDRTTIRPKVIFLATIMDYVLTEICNQTDMRFVFDGMEEEEDEETKTNLLIMQVEHGLATIDEARDELGKQPFGETKTSDPGWGTATGFQTFAEAEAQAQAQQAAMAQAPAGAVSQGAEPTPPSGGTPPRSPGGGSKGPAKPKPGKGPKSDATQSPGHEAAEESSNASSSSGTNQTPSNAPTPAKKALKFDSSTRQLSTIASVASAIAGVIVQLAEAHRSGELDGTAATQQGLAALGTGYAMVMSQAGQHAQDDGLVTEEDLANLDYTGAVGQRTEAQRQYLAQMLRMALTAPDLSWLPSRANLYASSLYGAYSEGYGTAVQQSHPDYQLVWRLGSSEHCRLCLNRAGQVFTFQTLPGWPGDGGFGGSGAVCLGGQNCRCSIDYVQGGQMLDSGGNTLQQAGYYAQQNQAISAWRDQVEANTDEFLAGLPNEAGSDVQLRAQSREDVRRELAILLNARIRAAGGYGGVSVEPQDIPAALVASIIPQYGPVPEDVPVTALMDAIDQYFTMKGAGLDLTKTELAGIFMKAIGDLRETRREAPRDGRLARAELEALARHLTKGRDPDTWKYVHVSRIDAENLVALIGKGVSRKAAVDRVAARWVDIGGQIHDTDEEPEDLPPTAVGDGHRVGSPGGLGGGAQLPHDANDHYFDRSDLKPHGDWQQGTATKGAADPHDPNPVEAEHVYNQLLENYPPKAIKWVKKVSWIGPIEVPIDRVDTDDVKKWAAHHEPDRVDHFAKKLDDGEDVKAAVCVQEPGEGRVKVVDGHHRYLGAAKADKKTFKAYVGFVKKNGGPWDETHVYQFHAGASPKNKAATLSKDEANYRPGTDELHRCRNCSMFQAFGDDEVGKCTLVKGDIRTDATCDHWDRATAKKAAITALHKAGNVAALHNWYQSGAGIDWGQPGDFAACVRIAGRHLANPEGFCAEAHHRALGKWPGQEKAAKTTQPIAAGLAVVALDTGNVLMLQRGFDEKDPAAGDWEFPGGCIEDGEEPLDAAAREWEEETGLKAPDHEPVASWRSPDEKYQGFVVTVPHQTDLEIFGDRDDVDNPDDPDGDHAEALAWWDPKDLATSTAVREELRRDAGHVAAALRSVTKLFTMLASAIKMDTVGSAGEENGSQMALTDPQAIIDAIKAGMLQLKLEKAEQQAVVADYVTLAWPGVLKYNSNQPRDAHGRFAPGGKKRGGGGGMGWLKAGGAVDSSHLSLKKNGDVVHKPTGVVIGHVDKQVDTPVKGASTFHTTHADGTKVYSSVYKGKALAAVAQHHNEAHAKATAPKLAEQPKPAIDHPSVTAHEPVKVVEMHEVATSHETNVVKPAEPQPWHKAGSNVDSKDLSLKLNGDVVHKPTGTVIAHVEKLKDVPIKGASTFITTHADGTKVYDSVYKGKALAAVAAHHNAAMTGQLTHTKPGAPEAPKVNEEWKKVPAGSPEGEFRFNSHDELLHGPTMTVIGTVKKNPEGVFPAGGFTATHADGTTMSATGHIDGGDKLLAHHNQVGLSAEQIAATKPAETAKPAEAIKPAEAPKQPYETIGQVGGDNTKWTMKPDKSGVDVTHESGAKVGSIVESGGAGNLVVTHADGTVVPHAGKISEATNALYAYHNSKYAGEPAPEWTKAGKLSTDVTKLQAEALPDGKTIVISHGGVKVGTLTAESPGHYTVQHASGFGGESADNPMTATQHLIQVHNEKIDAYQAKTGIDPAKAKVDPMDTHYNLVSGEITHPAAGTLGYAYTKKDGILEVTDKHGTTLGTVSKPSEAKIMLAAHHNGELIAPAEAPKPVETPKPVKDYHKAGSMVTPSDVTVKKDGTIVHKATGAVIGHVEKPGTGYWDAGHADGYKTTYNHTKGGAVKDVLLHHNMATAIETTVQPNTPKEWSKQAVKTGSLEMKAPDGVNPYSSKHVDVYDSQTKLKIGSIDSSAPGSASSIDHTLTHVSGAQFTFQGTKYSAAVKLGLAHNQAAAIAEGKTPEAPKSTPVKAFEAHTPVINPGTTSGKAPYQKVGTISAGSLHGTNVKKDASGKIIGSDMSHGDAVIGHTKANADGTLTLTHADGHVISTGIKPGSGQATAKLAQYHNTKYDDSTLPKPEVKPPPKLAPTGASQQHGGLHNNPEAAYTPPSHESKTSGFHDSATVDESSKTYSGVTGSHNVTLSSSEKSAIGYYTGSGYHPMNNFLRKGTVSSYNQTAVVNHINHLDTAFTKMPALKHSITTYRGVSNGAAMFGPVGSKVGKTWVEPGYTSTAAHASASFGGDTKIRITTPAGTHVLKPSGNGSYGDGEKEILLPRGAHFKVMRDEMVGGTRQVDLVMVGNILQ